ncbi:MAG: purine-nucleoside phosphorylase [Clostridia bacterium]|nr:purine-nucleoside phosphorylase [Clostridia bacterium]MBN2882845.1 purine-nucleoside phosphorylase [Clostridia bacterium]
MNELLKKLNKAADFIKKTIGSDPDIGMVLGSGLGVLSSQVADPVVIDYKDIPEFPVSTVQGHAGELVYGTLGGKKILVMKGRFHYYEGYEMEMAAFGIRVMKLLGIENVILTNAAGGINESYVQGCLMIITDHIGFFGPSPLRGPNIEEFGPRFPDMTEIYDRGLVKLAEECSRKLKIQVNKGIYCFAQGPQYETPAEIRAMRIIGADAVGMSTVPEAVAANHAGMKVLGISCITNMAAGMSGEKLSHKEVMETSERVRGEFLEYIKDIVVRMEV